MLHLQINNHINHVNHQQVVNDTLRNAREAAQLTEQQVLTRNSLQVFKEIVDKAISEFIKEYYTLGRDGFIKASVEELKSIPVDERVRALEVGIEVYHELCLQHRYELASAIEEVMDQVQ